MSWTKKRKSDENRTLQAIAYKIELNEDKKIRREQVGTLQAIAHKIEPNEEKEARRTGRHTPGGLVTRPNCGEEAIKNTEEPI